MTFAKDISGADYVIDNLSTYFIRPVQIENPVVITPVILEMSRRACKLEMLMKYQDNIVAKAMLTLQSIDHA